MERIIEKIIIDKTHPKAVKSEPHKQRAKKLVIIPPKIAPLFVLTGVMMTMVSKKQNVKKM